MRPVWYDAVSSHRIQRAQNYGRASIEHTGVVGLVDGA